MYRNVIDTDDYAASGIEIVRFAGGEYHANVPKWQYGHVHVHAKIRTWNDMGPLLVVMSALKSQGVAIQLFMPYFPGARQDRNPEGLTPLTSKVYADMIRPYVRTCTSVDLHSEVASEIIGPYLNNQMSPLHYLKTLINETPDLVLAPDKGAHDRAASASQLFNAYCAHAGKTREFETGKLTGFTAPDMSIIGPEGRILIVDDICDGGGTFVGLLAKIRETHTGPVDLYVTHGIFSKGLAPLDGFDNIYTTDSFYKYNPREGHVKTIELLPYYIGGLQA